LYIYVLLIDSLSSDTEEAETMKNGDLEATHFGERGVDVEWAIGTISC
jgi:hypothetical protein